MPAAPRRSSASGEHRLAEPPGGADLEGLRAAAAGCRACPLWKSATQTVFGEGPAAARLVLLGEQPGDREDREGRPFIGPAGRLLDRALAEAGIAREDCWLTNAVKHFKWVPRGKLRLHQSPGARDVASCRPWWEAELRRLQPRALVCLGATAAQAVLGRDARVERDRGRAHATPHAAATFVTAHPSALLRVPDEASREAAFARFVADLRRAADAARDGPQGAPG